MSSRDADPTPAARREWTARIFPLGNEPGDSLADVTTAEQRLAMVWELTLRMWALTGRPLPSYSRQNLPARLLRRQ